MDTKLLARIGAIAFVAVAITLTAIQMRGAKKAVSEDAATPAPATEVDADPRRDELIRCQSIGQAGASDTGCLRAWAENRRRFLALGAGPKAGLPDPAEAAVVAAQAQAAANPIGKSSDPVLGEDR